MNRTSGKKTRALTFPRDVSLHPGALAREEDFISAGDIEQLGLRRLATCMGIPSLSDLPVIQQEPYPLYVDREEEVFVVPTQDGISCISVLVDGTILETTSGQRHKAESLLQPRKIHAGSYQLERHRGVDLAEIYRFHGQRLREMLEHGARPHAPLSVNLLGAALARVNALVTLDLKVRIWSSVTLACCLSLALWFFAGQPHRSVLVGLLVLSFMAVRMYPGPLFFVRRRSAETLLRDLTNTKRKTGRLVRAYRWLDCDTVAIDASIWSWSNRPFVLYLLASLYCILMLPLLGLVFKSWWDRTRYKLVIGRQLIEFQQLRGREVVEQSKPPRPSLIEMWVEMLPLHSGRARAKPFTVSLVIDAPKLPLFIEIIQGKSLSEVLMEAESISERAGIPVRNRLSPEQVAAFQFAA